MKARKRRKQLNGTTLPPLLSLGDPQPVRMVHRGATGVMKSSWRDPSDTSPTAARTATEVSGWRSWDPLRKMLQQPSSSITPEHVHAADRFREEADLARLGFAPQNRYDVPINELAHGPKAGPSPAAIRQAKASISFSRACSRLTVDLQRMAKTIILGNCTVSAGCREESERLGRRVDPQRELGRLLCCLDLLAEYYGTEIERDLASGNVLPVSDLSSGRIRRLL
jgi:hypothetical protein